MLLYDKNALTLDVEGTGRGMLITYTVVLSFFIETERSVRAEQKFYRIQVSGKEMTTFANVRFGAVN